MLWIFLGSRWMETAPTSIKVLLRPTQSQSDEPSDLRGYLSPTSVYSTWQSPGGHPFNYEPAATLLNFSDRAKAVERTPYSVGLYIIKLSAIHLTYSSKYTTYGHKSTRGSWKNFDGFSSL